MPRVKIPSSAPVIPTARIENKVLMVRGQFSANIHVRNPDHVEHRQGRRVTLALSSGTRFSSSSISRSPRSLMPRVEVTNTCTDTSVGLLPCWTALSRNTKSSGNRSALRLTAWTKTRVSTRYIAARSASSMTLRLRNPDHGRNRPGGGSGNTANNHRISGARTNQLSPD